MYYEPFIVYSNRNGMLDKKLAECNTLISARNFINKVSKGKASCVWEFDGGNEEWDGYSIRRWSDRLFPL